MRIIKLLIFLIVFFVLVSCIIFLKWPQPDGTYPVGTRVYHWQDINRQEIYTPDPDDKREVVVQFWYPTKKNLQAQKAAYFLPVKDKINKKSNKILNFIFNNLNFFNISSQQETPVLSGEFPLVVFFHGYGGFRGQNTLLMEHLSSHGYIVASFDSLHETAIVIFNNGRVEWSKTKTPVDWSSPEGERVTQKWIDVRLADLKFLLGKIKELNSGSGFFKGSINLEKVGISGHSLGGMTVMQACRKMMEFTSCINIDAPFMKEDITDYSQPLLVLIASEIGGKPEEEALFFRQLKELSTVQTNIHYQIKVEGAGHYDFTDLSFAKLPFFSLFNAVGTISGKKMNNITNSLVREFFDLTLKDVKTDYFDQERYNTDFVFENSKP